MAQNIYDEQGKRGNANLQRVIDERSPEQVERDRQRATIEFKIRVNKVMGAPTENLEAALAALCAVDPDDYPGGPRVDGMTPHRAAIVEAWGKSR